MDKHKSTKLPWDMQMRSNNFVNGYYPWGAEGCCSCWVQNWMGARLTVWYKLHMLKVWCHYASLGKLYK